MRRRREAGNVCGGEDDAAANIVGGPQYSTLSNDGLMLLLAIAARSLYR